MAGNSSEDLLIGFDLGTSTIKALLADTNGNILGQACREVVLIQTEEGFTELDPQAYYERICAICQELVFMCPDVRNIRAICFSGATGNTLLLDDKYVPLVNAISWMDTRSVGKDTEIWPELDRSDLYKKTGWPYGGTFPLAHLGWWKKYRPDLWEKTKHFSMLNDFIYYKLCNNLVVDHSKASTFFLQNQIGKGWDKDVLAILEIEETMLPSLVPSGTCCGKITQEAAKLTGLDCETLVVTGSFDHPSAARSVGVFEEGEILISAGTSWVMFSPIGDRNTALKGSMLIDPFLSPSGCWGAMFSLTAISEKLHDYLEKSIGSDAQHPPMERYNSLASEARIGAGGLSINLFKQSYSEMEDRLQGYSPPNITRALMEGIIFLTRNRLERFSNLTGIPVKKVVLTGGPTKSPLIPYILADVLNCPVTIAETGQHAGAMGSVILAGIGAGLVKDESDGYERTRSDERIIIPDPIRSKRYQQIYTKYATEFELSHT